MFPLNGAKGSVSAAIVVFQQKLFFFKSKKNKYFCVLYVIRRQSVPHYYLYLILFFLSFLFYFIFLSGVRRVENRTVDNLFSLQCSGSIWTVYRVCLYLLFFL